jgi:hypothetical protein
MDNLIEIFLTHTAIAISLLLILKPFPFMKFTGNVYWHLSKFTEMGKSEETKNILLAKIPFGSKCWAR